MSREENDQKQEETFQNLDDIFQREVKQKQRKTDQNNIEFTIIPETEAYDNQKGKEEFNNTYQQGYLYVLRLLWFHLWSIAKKLKIVEKQGRKIEIDDIPYLEEQVKVEYSVKKMKERLSKLDLNRITSNQFIKVIIQTFWRNIIIIDMYALFEGLSKMFSPFCTAKIINLVKEGDNNQAFVWVIFLIIGHFFAITFGQQSWTKTQRTSVQVRLGLINLLYDKVSSLSTYSIKKANIGKIINMVSSDFSAIEWNIAYLFQCILTPILFTISSAMLINSLGFAGVVGIILLISMIPLQQKIAKAAAVYSKMQTQNRDKKVKIFAEMIEGIRIIKMYGWEKTFIDMINKLRKKEVRNTLYAYVIQYMELTISLNGTVFIALFCLIICEFTSSIEVNTALIFYTIELINLMSSIIMKYIGQFMNFIQDFNILFSRLMSVLNIENVQMKSIDTVQDQNLDSKIKPGTVLYMDNFSAYWQTENLDNKSPVLRDINFVVNKGETVSIIGQIGSGKTSLLYAIMKEIPRYKGSFFSTDKISYVEQEPYIFQGTVRDNILFGKPFEQEFYLQVIRACCLIDDLKIFNNGDQTLIGEKGANLSGGQRARLCLARAVYADNDLYLLDDPLSAVDSKVAKQIFNNVINGMLKNKSVILVTHQLNYALRCQKIAVFDNGTIVLQGNPQQINFSDTLLAKYINEQQLEVDQQENNVKILSQSSSFSSLEESNNCTEKELDQNNIESNLSNTCQNHQNYNSQKDSKQFELQLIKSCSISQSKLLSACEQKEEEYPITLNSYKKYLKVSPNPYYLIVVLLAFGLQELMFTIFYKFIAIYETGISTESFYTLAFLIYIAFFLLKFVQNALCSNFILKINQNITEKMISGLSKAKPILYDDIPSGTIINKFTTDINILDKQLPAEVYGSLEGILHFSVIILTVIFTNQVNLLFLFQLLLQLISHGLFRVYIKRYHFFCVKFCYIFLSNPFSYLNLLIILFQQYNQLVLIPVIIEICIFYKILKHMKSLLLRTKQLDLENKAPIFQFFSSSLSGVLVINMYKQREQFNKRMATLMNNSIRTYDVFFFVSRLFSVLMQYTCLATSGIGITIVLSFNNTGHGQFGQTVTFLIILLNFFHLTLRAIINMDAFMISSERAFSIIDMQSEKTDIENDLESPNCVDQQKSKYQKSYTQVSLKDTKQDESLISNQIEENGSITSNSQLPNISDQWPSKGELIFEKVYMKYKEEFDHVLKGVSFHANPRERIAIVGRTGAGKSSIIQSLFRMSEIDIKSNEGFSRILYDEKDIKTISLHKLRRSIGIIPQNPFVFSGSIYHNIDPLEEYDEKEILRVLKETGLEVVIDKLPKGIHTDMSDSSSVFSMGQKQLVCLARVMLRNHKLIVLDEATANVDMDTDQKIQYLLKSMFQDSTIITIAHRLNTIADYDKVIVLDQGQVIEVDQPYNLLALNQDDTTITNTSTLFSQMVLHTGPKNAEKIFQMCKETYLASKKSK